MLSIFKHYLWKNLDNCQKKHSWFILNIQKILTQFHKENVCSSEKFAKHWKTLLCKNRVSAKTPCSVCCCGWSLLNLCLADTFHKHNFLLNSFMKLDHGNMNNDMQWWNLCNKSDNYFTLWIQYEQKEVLGHRRRNIAWICAKHNLQANFAGILRDVFFVLFQSGK